MVHDTSDVEMGLDLLKLLITWDHYYCSRCRREHRVNRSGIVPIPSTNFLKHLQYSRDPIDRRRTWAGRRLIQRYTDK